MVGAKLVGSFLTSKASGYLALAGLAAAGGLYWYVDELKDNYEELRLRCLQKDSPDVDALAEELKDLNKEQFDELREMLNASNADCLDWVYDPDNPPVGSSSRVPGTDTRN